MFEELRGPRVLLRPYTLADAAERYAANDESRDHLRPWEPEQADAFHTLDETRDSINYANAKLDLAQTFLDGYLVFKPTGTWAALACARASPTAGLSPRFRLATGCAPPSKATATSARRSGL